MSADESGGKRHSTGCTARVIWQRHPLGAGTDGQVADVKEHVVRDGHRSSPRLSDQRRGLPNELLVVYNIVGKLQLKLWIRALGVYQGGKVLHFNCQVFTFDRSFIAKDLHVVLISKSIIEDSDLRSRPRAQVGLRHLEIDLRRVGTAEIVWREEVIQISVTSLHEVLEKIQSIIMEKTICDLHIRSLLLYENGTGSLNGTTSVLLIFPGYHSNNLNAIQDGSSVVLGECAVLNLGRVNLIHVDGSFHVRILQVEHMVLEIIWLFKICSSSCIVLLHEAVWPPYRSYLISARGIYCFVLRPVSEVIERMLLHRQDFIEGKHMFALKK